MLAVRLGQLGQRPSHERAVLLEGDLADDDRLPLDEAPGHAGPAALALPRHLAQLGALLGIGQQRHLLVEGLGHHDVPHVEVGEERRLLQREPRVEGDRAKQVVELGAATGGVFDEAASAGVEAEEEDGAAARAGDVEQVLAVGVVGLACAGRKDLDDPAIELAERAAERHALVVGGEPRRDRLAFRPGVSRRDRRAP